MSWLSVSQNRKTRLIFTSNDMQYYGNDLNNDAYIVYIPIDQSEYWPGVVIGDHVIFNKRYRGTIVDILIDSRPEYTIVYVIHKRHTWPAPVINGQILVERWL